MHDTHLGISTRQIFHCCFSSTLPNMDCLQNSQCELVSFDLEQRSEGRLTQNFQKAVEDRSGNL